MRIKPEAFHAVPGVPRSSEYESVLEQDPFGDTHETGGNDDIWGEWGLDKDAPFLSTLQALGLWSVGMTSLYVFYKTALANSPKPVAVCCASRRRAPLPARAHARARAHVGLQEPSRVEEFEIQWSREMMLVALARVALCTPNAVFFIPLLPVCCRRTGAARGCVVAVSRWRGSTCSSLCVWLARACTRMEGSCRGDGRECWPRGGGDSEERKAETSSCVCRPAALTRPVAVARRFSRCSV